MKLSELAAKHGVSIYCSFVGLTTRDEKWRCFEWAVTLTRDGRAPIKLPYYCGVAHVVKLETPRVQRNALRDNPKLQLFDGTALGVRAVLDDRFQPTPPKVADVLESLLLDSDVLDSPFEEWADELGYSSDSIKAKATYDICRDYGLKVKRLLGAEFDAFRQAASEG